MSNISNTQHQATVAARASIDTDSSHGAVIPPLYLSSNFAFEGYGEKRQYDYTRSGNPNRDQLADALAALEGGSGGVVTSSGMSAVHLVTQLLKPGETVIAAPDCYGGCHRLFSAASDRGQFDLQWVELWETERAIVEIQQARPRMVWIETPSNPLLRITDISAIAEAAHGVGAVVVVDNTFLSPVGQRPFELGADIVIHSTTKYINGHSDVVGGAALARDPELVEELAWWANCLGLTGAPFDSFQTLRGLRTLPIRYRQHQENAVSLADFLDSHSLVSKVYYPGLKNHPGYQLAKRQQQGPGAMLSFELDASQQEIRLFLKHLRHFTLAESLGGVESLIAHPSSMTHAAVSEEDQLAAGLNTRLLRLSVGIEFIDDLLWDISQALDAVQASREHKAVRSVA